VNNPKDKLRDYLNQIINRFLNTKSLFDELKLINSWSIPDRIETLNHGYYFFQLTTYSMRRIFLVELATILSKKEQRSLIDWLKKAQEHAKSIYPTRYNPNYKGDREPIMEKEYKSIIDQNLRDLNAKANVIGQIKAWRDKLIAHLDKDYFNTPSAIYKDYPINDIEIDQLIETVSKILHDHYHYLFQADLRMEILSETNVDSVLNYVRAFQRIRKDKRLINSGFKPMEYLG
jgi:hypothetical protein